MVISYLPVLYQAFSRREVTISLLDARAGSPPTAAELLIRLGPVPQPRRCSTGSSEEWERWAAEVLESHVSFPVLSYYRSQHDNQSWLAALTAILDTSALVIAGVQEGGPVPGLADLRHGPARGRGPGPGLPRPARRAGGGPPSADRLAAAAGSSARRGSTCRDGAGVERTLAELRGMYEPFVNALSLTSCSPCRRCSRTASPWTTGRPALDAADQGVPSTLGAPDPWTTTKIERLHPSRADTHLGDLHREALAMS